MFFSFPSYFDGNAYRVAPAARIVFTRLLACGYIQNLNAPLERRSMHSHRETMGTRKPLLARAFVKISARLI